MMRGIIYWLLGLMLAPLHWVAHLVTRASIRKDAALAIHLEFRDGLAYISVAGPAELRSSAELIAAYLLFLSQFFFSCDPRQIEPVATALTNHIVSGGHPWDTARRVLNAVLATFDHVEEKAYRGVFTRGAPPDFYATGPSPKRPTAKYSLISYKKRGVRTANLHMSYGMLLVFFPLSVGLLYVFTHNSMDDANKERFESCVLEFLSEFRLTDFRSTAWGASSPSANKIIATRLGI